MSNVAQLDLPETVIVLSVLEVCLRGDVIADIKDQTTARALVTRLAAALEAEAERRARAGLDPITPEELERFEIGDAGAMLDMARAEIMKNREQLQAISDELHESWLNGNHEVVTKAILALPKPAAVAVSAIIACKLYDSDGSRVRFMRRLMRGAECHQTSQN